LAKMTRILLLTTALIASAATAQAEVTLSGDARMGVIKPFPALGSGESTSIEFTSRARVKVDMTSETDGGLSFGGSFRINEAGDAATGHAGEVFISGEWGTLSMGDVDGAALSAIDHVSYVGLTDLESLNELRYIANGFEDTDPSVLYKYNRGEWTFYASVVNPGTVTETTVDTVDPNIGYVFTSAPGVHAYSVAARYETERFAVAFGYEKNHVDYSSYDAGSVVDQQNLMLGVEGKFNDLTLKAIVGHFEGSDVAFINDVSVLVPNISGTQYAVSADYVINDLTLTAFYADDSRYDGTKAYGVGAEYDLGGDASVKGGYVKDKADGASSFDLGISMSF